jgi:hypothetical protein
MKSMEALKEINSRPDRDVNSLKEDLGGEIQSMGLLKEAQTPG